MQDCTKCLSLGPDTECSMTLNQYTLHPRFLGFLDGKTHKAPLKNENEKIGMSFYFSSIPSHLWNQHMPEVLSFLPCLLRWSVRILALESYCSFSFSVAYVIEQYNSEATIRCKAVVLTISSSKIKMFERGGIWIVSRTPLFKSLYRQPANL